MSTALISLLKVFQDQRFLTSKHILEHFEDRILLFIILFRIVIYMVMMDIWGKGLAINNPILGSIMHFLYRHPRLMDFILCRTLQG